MDDKELDKRGWAKDLAGVMSAGVFMAVLGALWAFITPRVKSVPIPIIWGFVGGVFVGAVGWFQNTNKGKKLNNNMNKKQKVCLWSGVAVFGLMLAFSSSLAGRTFVKNTLSETIICISVFLIRSAIVVVLTGSLIYILRDKKPKDKQKQ
jgi:hypothetical protein